MRWFGFVSIALVSLVAVPAQAQGSGSSSRGGGSRSDSNFSVTRNTKASVVELNLEEGFVSLAKEKGGEKLLFRLHSRVKLKADKKTGLHKRKLTLADFPAGSRVKVKYRPSDSNLLELKLIPAKKKT